MNFKDKNLEEFTTELGSKTSVPGGGGAAALAGALGISLGSMVGNFTLGKKKYAEVEPEIKSLLAKAEELRQSLLALIDEDAKAFEPLSQAYSITKDDPQRADLLEAATMAALQPPLKILRVCGEAMDILRQMQLKGSVMLVSDAGCGAALCKAAMEAAAMNVYINTKSLLERKLAEEIDKETDDLLKKYLPLGETIISEVTAILRK